MFRYGAAKGYLDVVKLALQTGRIYSHRSNRIRKLLGMLCFAGLLLMDISRLPDFGWEIGLIFRFTNARIAPSDCER